MPPVSIDTLVNPQELRPGPPQSSLQTGEAVQGSPDGAHSVICGGDEMEPVDRVTRFIRMLLGATLAMLVLQVAAGLIERAF